MSIARDNIIFLNYAHRVHDEEYLTFIRKLVDESPFGKLLKQYDVKHK